MARRTFDVIDVTEILVHWHAGRSLNEMSGSLGVDRKTIRKYIAPALAAGMADDRGLASHVASVRRYSLRACRKRPAGRRSWCGARGRSRPGNRRSRNPFAREGRAIG